MIITPERLDFFIVDLKEGLRQSSAKKKIATTNGCFDLLHIGHTRFLQSIKKIADILVVCVNSDESAKRLKGEGRPIVPLAERMEILDALECVDYVVSFEEDTPCEILAQIKPDIHVKDSSYTFASLTPPDFDKGDTQWKSVMPEKDIVEKNGGIVVLLPRLEGYSTSDIIQKVYSSIGAFSIDFQNLAESLRAGTKVTIKSKDGKYRIMDIEPVEESVIDKVNKGM